MQPFTDVKGMLVAAQTTDTARNIAGYVEDRTEKEVHKIKWKQTSHLRGFEEGRQ